MSFDAHKNFSYSTVATAPSPATSGTSLVVQAGDGAKFPAAPFNATVWPAGVQPTSDVAEIVRVTAKSTDTLTITRAQESSSARSILVGDQIAATITAKSLTDIENAAGGVGSTLLAYQEFDYTSTTGYFNVPNGSSGHATTTDIVDCASITVDGSTEICIEFYCAAVEPDYLSYIGFELYDGSTLIDAIGDSSSPTANVSSQQRGGKSITARVYLTPTAGSHTYSIRAYSLTGTHNYLWAGSNIVGGDTNPHYHAGHLRISRGDGLGPVGATGATGPAGSPGGATGATGSVGATGPAGASVIGYDQITASVNVTGTTESGATSVISCAAHTFDGNPVLATFCGILSPPNNAAGDTIFVALFEGSTIISRLAILQNGAAAGGPETIATITGSFRFTPTAASHTYTVKSWVTNTTGTPKVVAGAGGTAANSPAYVRFISG